MKKIKHHIWALCISLMFFFIFQADTVPEASESFSHQDIAAQSVIFDLHCDTVYRFYKLGSISPFIGKKLQVTLPRLKQAGVKAQFFAAWVPPSKGFKHADYLIDLFERMLDKHSGDLAFAGSYKDLRRNLANKRISAFLGIENGKPIGTDLKKLDYFYNRGVRYVTLTWNQNNKIADASGDRRKLYNGLSPFGEQVIRKMNHLGMIIDVSHSSDDTVKDVLRISIDPIIASHSCCYSLRHIHRNLKDELIKDICDRGGVIGVNFYAKFLTDKNVATVSNVADHIDHIVKIGGLNCAALGSDYDGMTRPARGLENIGKLENLTRELIKRGYTKGETEKIYGRNFIRVLQNVVDK